MSTLFHVHDPMCSWCWAFKPTWQKIASALPSSVEVKRVLGGLAPDTDAPMPDAMRDAISGYWRHIETAVPGTRFNHAFWTECTPRRATYPACRAVVTARLLDPTREEAINARIQEAYYLEARNPSDDATLIDVAVDVGFAREEFSDMLASEAVRTAFTEDLQLGAALGVQGFPSLVLQHGDRAWRIRIDYNDAAASLADIDGVLSEHTAN